MFIKRIFGLAKKLSFSVVFLVIFYSLSFSQTPRRNMAVNFIPVFFHFEFRVNDQIAIGPTISFVKWDKRNKPGIQQKLIEWQYGLAMTTPLSFLKNSDEKWFQNRLFTSGINYTTYLAFETQKYESRKGSISRRKLLAWNHLLYYQYAANSGLLIKGGTGLVSSYMFEQKIIQLPGDTINLKRVNKLKAGSEPVIFTFGWLF